MQRRIPVLLLCACIVAAAAGPAEAQLGGLLKKKAKELVPPPPVQTEATKPRSDEAAASALSAPDVVPITQDAADRFKTGLALEIKLRGEFRTMLATMKTREEYQLCQGEVAMSPEAQAISMQFAQAAEKAAPADQQKAMIKMYADITALTTKRCGGDPAAWNDGKRAERLREIEATASDAAAPPGSAAQAAPHAYRRAYAMLKERYPPYCGWLSTQKGGTAGGSYQSIPGVGSGVYVYSKAETSVLTATCTSVMELLMKSADSVASDKR